MLHVQLTTNFKLSTIFEEPNNLLEKEVREPAIYNAALYNEENCGGALWHLKIS